MVGYGWIWFDMVGHTHKIESKPFVCPCIQTNTTLHIFLIKGKRKFDEWRGAQAHPSLEYISGLILIGCGPA